MVMGHVSWESAKSDSALHQQYYLSVLGLEGQGPTGRYVGDFLALSNSEGFSSLRAYSCWFEFSGADWSLRGGSLLADEEFAGTDGGGYFMNSAFGWPAFISANTINTGPAFYVAALGLRLELKPNESTIWRVGIYDGDSFDSPIGDPEITRDGLHFHVGGAQGWFIITEVAFAPSESASRFKIGGWMHTADFADLGNPARTHGSNWGAYAAFERTIAGKSGEAGNVEYFIRAGFSPSDRNTVGWAFDTGVAWTGPLQSRAEDVLAIGVAHARFGSDFRNAALLANPTSPVPDYETSLELSYTAKLSEHVDLQPDLQFLAHPGGSRAQRDSLVLLLRLNASY